jgi:hypothetical protein
LRFKANSVSFSRTARKPVSATRTPASSQEKKGRVTYTALKPKRVKLPFITGDHPFFRKSARSCSRSVHTGSHWLTLVNNKKNSPENFRPTKCRLPLAPVQLCSGLFSFVQDKFFPRKNSALTPFQSSNAVNRVNSVKNPPKAPPFQYFPATSPKTFGHFNISKPTPQNPAPFQCFRNEFFTPRLPLRLTATLEVDK